MPMEAKPNSIWNPLFSGQPMLVATPLLFSNYSAV
jgi:hypothetical protein